MRSSLRFASVLPLAAFLASCSDGPPKPASVSASSNANQTAPVATAVTERPAVKIVDNKGNPYAGFPVTFAVTGGGGLLSRTVDTTDANGIATAGVWRMGNITGTNTVSATAEGLSGSPVTFTATGVAGNPVVIAVDAGDNQTAAAGTAVAVAPTVVLRDQFTNLVPGATVTFAVTAGGGSVTTASATTNANGAATSGAWTLGTVAGVNTLTATAQGTSVVSFTATAQPGPASAAVFQRQPSGAASGSVIARQPILRITDAFGNRITSATNTVTAAIASGSGTLSGTTSVAAVNGVASFTNLAITGTGPTTLSFTVSGIATPATSASFTVSPPAGPATTLAVGTAPSGAVSAVPFTGQPDVEIRDASGIIVTAGSVPVTASVTSTTGTLIGTTTVNSVNGIASFSDLAISGSGTYTISFSATGLTGASTGALTVAPPPISSVALFSGDKQAAFAGTAVQLNPVVRVIGTSGTPLPGARVTFAAALGDGSVTGATVITDANGIATVGNWTLGASPNFNTLTATVEGNGVNGNPVTFSASGCSPGGPGFKLTLCFTSDMTPTQKSAFTSAAARWEGIIKNDPEDASSTTPLSAGSCGANSYRIPADMVIDDLLIFASVVAIDGPGQVLGSAGPCFVRLADPTGQTLNVGDFPVIGQMRFDVADMAQLESTSSLNSVILHEMGHVLGIGVFWDALGMLKNRAVVGQSPAPDTYFNGANAITGFNEIGFSGYAGNKVPVENTGGSGTINAHWRESTLTNELMTGFLSGSNNPLTALTIRSLADLGYTVDVSVADRFAPPPAFSVAPGSGTAGGFAPIDLRNDLYNGPLYGLDRRGRIVKIR